MKKKNGQPTNPFHPGEMLLEEFLEPLNMSKVDFAKRLGWTTAKLNELIKGKKKERTHFWDSKRHQSALTDTNKLDLPRCRQKIGRLFPGRRQSSNSSKVRLTELIRQKVKNSVLLRPKPLRLNLKTHRSLKMPNM